MSTAPRNPFMLDGSIQPIIHYDCGQSDAIDVEMWSGEHVVEPAQVSYLPAPVGIPGCVHRPYLDGTAAMIVSTNCSVTKVRIDGGRFEVVNELVVPGQERTYPAPGEVAALVETMDAAYLDEPAFLAAFKAYLVEHGVSVVNGPFGLYTVIGTDTSTPAMRRRCSSSGTRAMPRRPRRWNWSVRSTSGRRCPRRRGRALRGSSP